MSLLKFISQDKRPGMARAMARHRLPLLTAGAVHVGIIVMASGTRTKLPVCQAFVQNRRAIASSCASKMQQSLFSQQCSTTSTALSPSFLHLQRNNPTQHRYHSMSGTGDGLNGKISVSTATFVRPPRRPSTLVRYAGADNNNDESESEDEIETTWTYTPYKPPPPNGRGGRSGRGGRGNGGSRRQFSSDTWKVPNKITIPEDRLEVSFVRSSGAGGQNVNKVNTKVEMRFIVNEATWIPGEVRTRIRQNEANRINKEGYLTVTSHEYRTQAQNRKDALKKLEDIILKSYPRPKVRKLRKGVSKKAKERKKEDKKRRSQTKANRKRIDF